MPVLAMLSSILLFSLWASLIGFSVQQVNIWELIFLVEVLTWGASLLIVKTLAAKRQATYKRLRDLPACDRRSFALCGLLRVLSQSCLFSSFFFLSIAGAVSIFDFWPVIALYIAPLMAGKLHRGGLSIKEVILSMMAFGGVALIIFSETREFVFAAETPLWQCWGILLLPLASSFFNAVEEVLKTSLRKKIEMPKYPLLSVFAADVNYGFFCTVFAAVAFFLTRHFGIGIESSYSPEIICAIAFIAVGIFAAGRFLYTFGMTRGRHMNMRVLWVLKPVLTLLWLWLFGLSAVGGMVILGVAMITAANLLISAKPDGHSSYPATIVTLVLAGVYCYFFEGLNVDDYYQALAGPLFFYAIIIAFLMDRLIRRDRFEEGLVVEMIEHVELHGPKTAKAKSALVQKLLEIVKTSDTAAIEKSYQALRNGGHKVIGSMTGKLDALALSRLQGVNFGEMLVLFLIGLLSIAVLIIFRTTNFVGDCFAVVLSATTVFMFFTTVDLVRQRREFHLDIDKIGGYGFSKKVTKTEWVDIMASVILVLAVVAAVIGVLWARREGLDITLR